MIGETMDILILSRHQLTPLEKKKYLGKLLFFISYAPMALIFPCFFYDNHMSKAMNSRNILCAQGCFFVVNIAVSFHDIYYIKNVKSSCKFFFQHFLIDVFVYLY